MAGRLVQQIKDSAEFHHQTPIRCVLHKVVETSPVIVHEKKPQVGCLKPAESEVHRPDVGQRGLGVDRAACVDDGPEDMLVSSLLNREHHV